MELSEFLSKLPKVIEGKKVIKWKAITQNDLENLVREHYYYVHSFDTAPVHTHKHHEHLTVKDGFGMNPQKYLLHRPIFKSRIG